MLFVSDASQEYTAPELEFLKQATAVCPNVLCVLSKTDLYPEWARIAELDREHLAAAEAERRILLNQPTLAFDLSGSSLFFVSDRQCNVGDPRYGWDVPSSLDDLVNTGISFEADYPYRDQNQTAIFTKGDSQTFRINGYDSTSDTTQMKRWLVEDGRDDSDSDWRTPYSWAGRWLARG